MLRAPLDEHGAMFRQLPYGLRIALDERRRGAEQPFVPLQGRWVVGDRNPGVQVEGPATA